MFISETIKSVKSQSFLNWECVIIDDNSNDDSLKGVKNEIINDNDFIYLKIQKIWVLAIVGI